MDRNIVTKAQAIRENREALERRRQQQKAEDRANDQLVLGGDETTKQDAPVTKLAKYIPGEALSLYLALAGVAAGAQLAEGSGPTWFAALIALVVVFNILYLRRIWRVKRWSQILVSTVSLVVYAFGTGGALVETLSFYKPTLAAFAVIATTAFLAFFDPPEPAS